MSDCFLLSYSDEVCTNPVFGRGCIWCSAVGSCLSGSDTSICPQQSCTSESPFCFNIQPATNPVTCSLSPCGQNVFARQSNASACSNSAVTCSEKCWEQFITISECSEISLPSPRPIPTATSLRNTVTASTTKPTPVILQPNTQPPAPSNDGSGSSLSPAVIVVISVLSVSVVFIVFGVFICFSPKLRGRIRDSLKRDKSSRSLLPTRTKNGQPVLSRKISEPTFLYSSLDREKAPSIDLQEAQQSASNIVPKSILNTKKSLPLIQSESGASIYGSRVVFQTNIDSSTSSRGPTPSAPLLVTLETPDLGDENSGYNASDSEAGEENQEFNRRLTVATFESVDRFSGLSDVSSGSIDIHKMLPTVKRNVTDSS